MPVFIPIVDVCRLPTDIEFPLSKSMDAIQTCEKKQAWCSKCGHHLTEIWVCRRQSKPLTSAFSTVRAEGWHLQKVIHHVLIQKTPLEMSVSFIGL